MKRIISLTNCLKPTIKKKHLKQLKVIIHARSSSPLFKILNLVFFMVRKKKNVGN